MAVSGTKLGLLAVVGPLLAMLLLASCTDTSSTSTTETTLPSSTSTSTSVSTTSTSTGAASAAVETHRVMTRFRSVEPKLTVYWGLSGSGDFPTDTAQAVTLQLGFSPFGSLESLFIVAYAADTQQLLTATAFGAYTGYEPSGEYIDISGAVVDGVSMDVLAPTVTSYLAAIELVGRETMLAQLPALPEPSLGTYPGYYLLEAWPRAGGEQNIPSDAKALVWDGSTFQPLAPGDPRRQADLGYVRFVATPVTPVYSPPVTVPQTQTTTTEGVDTWPVFFIIPASSGSAQGSFSFEAEQRAIGSTDFDLTGGERGKAVAGRTHGPRVSHL